MRWVMGALVAVALAQGARAADLDILRGSETVGPATFTRWSGFYAGGQVSYSGSNVDFSQATQPLIALSLRETALENTASPSSWPVLGKGNATAQGFGGFVGYNTQWQDLALGLELNYTRSSLLATATSTPLTRVVGDGIGNTDNVTVTGSGSLNIIDYGTLRARAGWILGSVLPYGFVGFVLGRGDINLSSTVSGTQTAPDGTVTPFSFTESDIRNSALLYGFAVGGGVDFALTSNIFVRGEVEFVQFARVSDMVANIVTGRVAAGVKF